STKATAVLFTFLLPILLLGVLLWLFAQPGGEDSAGQAFSFGQSQAQLVQPGERSVTLEDVAGLAEVKEELAEVIDFLRHPARYEELGARIPRGIILSGPPGTGKTLLAKAVAGEAGVSFFSAAGSDFVEIFAGVGASRVRDLFTKARRSAPCVIFIDEIDAVARRRGQSAGGGVEEREQTLNQLLVEMDGFATDGGIIVMAATNRIDTLDPAILRPGRFDRQIIVDPPDRRGREAILQVHARQKPLAPDADLSRVAALTVGFTGADLANLLNEAALLTARHRHEAIGMSQLLQAYERVVTGGPQRQVAVSSLERERIAVHEAGHALIAHHLPGADPVAKISLLPRGRRHGYTLFQPQEDRMLYTEAHLLDRLAVHLGGRAAEELIWGEGSTGAADDLEQATKIARRMVAEWGMSALGPVLFGGESGLPTAERTIRQVDGQVKQLVERAHGRARGILEANRGALERLTERLLAQESLEGEELQNVLASSS
ncbi:MAG TPA: ATP-dependent zinc metalloprotease FtsH, partial [Symbiobacteriaceae bacterium]|nr:ATP-dependent zinc metalloprotease FtsH [Symbiobacteriaceae bacterium]